MNENYLKNELTERMKQDENIYNFLHNGSLDGLWYWDLEQTENKYMNSTFWELFGIDPTTKEHKFCEWEDLIFPEDLKIAKYNYKRHLENPDYPYDQVVRYYHANGSTVWVRCRGIIIRDDSGKAIRMLGAHTDVTKYKQLEEELRKTNEKLLKKQKEIIAINKTLEEHAMTDPLTLLYNRHFVNQFLKMEKEKADRHKSQFSVIVVDIDDFKLINDSYGHLGGDAVLIDFANTLKELLRKQDLVARWGGDEFIVVLPNTGTEGHVALSRKLINAFNKRTVDYLGAKIPYSISYGISCYELNTDLNDSIHKADLKLYEMKNKQKAQ